ncbi:hypothetical protein [Streptomyces sp. NPDC060035]|uniref:hypothetical protein n=1 Tax=Streptomyces sp. NPDC060035 TaxID=3347044 RepID=UPI0036A85AB4
MQGLRCSKPLLDGLDEMPPQARAEALAALSRQLGRGERLVLTCRADEYQRTVEESTVLTAAAVVELCPPDPADLQTYLRVSTAPARTGCWDPLFAEVESTPGGPVAQALSTPLIAWLARTAYADTASDPAELLAGTNLDGAPLISTKPQDDAVFDVRNIVIATHPAGPQA